MTNADRLYSILSEGRGVPAFRIRERTGLSFRSIDNAMYKLRGQGVPVKKINWGAPAMHVYSISDEWLAKKAKADQKARDRLDRQFCKLIGIDPDARGYDRWFGMGARS